MQYRIRTLLILVAIAAALALVVSAIRSIDGPFATLLVSDNHTLELTDDVAISLTESALRKIDFDPVRPIPSHGPSVAMYSVGRNAHDSDRITITWEIRGQKYPDYTVRLNRNEQGIVASIYKNWLQ